ncbi:MAG: hypothetical protein JWM33_986 [Caulobacteraceae bacterium]|nr:hypothetical protein [Caulobacteraceae bacterium]
MRHLTLPVAIAGLLVLAACSKPAADTAAGAADATANAAAGVTAPGGAVSPPAANEAVNADGQTGPAAAASNSFTSDQAADALAKAGYTNVTGLTKTPDGMWTAKATKDGKTSDVSLDFKGAITAR